MSITVLFSRTMPLCGIFLVVVSLLCSLHQSTTAQKLSEAKTLNSSYIQFGNYQLNDQEWHRVHFNNSIPSPVVIAGPPSYNDKDIIQIQVKEVTEFGFDIRLVKFECVIGAVKNETAINETTSWIAISSGTYKSDNNKTFFVGRTVVAESNSEENIQTKASFPVPFSKPVAMSLIQENDVALYDIENIVLSRVTAMTELSISLIVENEKSHGGTFGKMVGFIVFEYGVGVLLGDKYYGAFKYPLYIKKSIEDKMNVRYDYRVIHPLIVAVSCGRILLRRDSDAIGKYRDLIVQQAVKCQSGSLSRSDIKVEFIAIDVVSDVVSDATGTVAGRNTTPTTITPATTTITPATTTITPITTTITPTTTTPTTTTTTPTTTTTTPTTTTPTTTTPTTITPTTTTITPTTTTTTTTAKASSHQTGKKTKGNVLMQCYS